MIDYQIRRRQPGESNDAVSAGRGKLVARIRCEDCLEMVCAAQTEDWPPTGTVTLHIGPTWPEPQIVGDNVLCGYCGGTTWNA